MAKIKHKRRNYLEDTRSTNVVPISKKRKYQVDRGPAPIIAMNSKQAEYLGYLRSHPQVFVLGPAGTGKTWMAASYAADLYRGGVVKKIILTRPNVPCGRSLGFFPGTLENKFAPWAVPITDTIRDRLGAAVFDIALKNGNIEVVPFEVMRGRSWRDSFVILDEAQNASAIEIKMFLTRIGEDCITVVNGDVSQCDLEKQSGLRVALNLIRDKGLPIPIVEFSVDVIVRSGMCALWVRAFEGVT